MKIFDRYIAKTVVGAILLVLLVFIGLIFFISLIRQISDVGTGEYNLFAVLMFVVLDLPQQIYMLFPVASLIGIMLGLSVLANHSELTVLRASGVSLNQIVLSVLKASVVLLIIVTLIGEWLAPITESFAIKHKETLTSNGQSLTTRHGTWIRDGQNFIYIRTILNNRHLEGVSRYQLDSHYKLIQTDYAKSGSYENRQWVMKDVVSSKIHDQQVTSSRTAVSYWNLAISPRLLHIAVIDPSTMSLIQLYDYIHYLKSNNLNTGDYALTFWQRIFKPFATIVMMLLAIPFVFGSLRTIAIGFRIVMGIMIGFSFSLANQFFGPLTMVYQLPSLIAALTPTVLFALFAFWLLKRVS